MDNNFRKFEIRKPHAKTAFLSLIMLILINLVVVPQAFAAFVKIDEVNLITRIEFGGTSVGISQHGIAYDGSNWYFPNAQGDPFPGGSILGKYDNNYEYIESIWIPGLDSTRGLTYDRNSDHLFIGDQDTGIVREITKGGDKIQQFSASGLLNALAYDAATDTIWSAHFSGIIEHRTRSGALISSFDGGLNWTGLAIDEINNTLILLKNTDTVYEFKYDGTLIGQIISTDMIAQNGQGLAYDSMSGTLWATGQFGKLTILQDASRVPEPATLSLLALGAAAMLRRRRRSC